VGCAHAASPNNATKIKMNNIERDFTQPP
jgi:hypothetical protein